MEEQWKEFPLGYKSKFRYAISNHGRLVSFTDDIDKGQLLKGGSVCNYKIFRYKVYRGETAIYKHLFFHHLVATLFMPDKSDNQTYVLHLDYNKQNNHIDNLQWATKEQMVEHSKKNPAVLRGRQRAIEFKRHRNGHKLTVANVQFLKKKMLDPNRKTRLKILVRQFGVSEMTLHRIRTGENWGHIKI